MKVLIAGEFGLPNQSNVSAIPRVIQNTLDGLDSLSKKNLDLEILSLNSDIRKDMKSEYKGYIVHYIAYRRPKFLFGIIKNAKALCNKILEIKPDLVHTHDLPSSLAAIYSEVPHLLTIHGIVWKEMQFYRNISGKLRGLFYSSILKYVLLQAKNIHVINPYLSNEIRNYSKANEYQIEVPISKSFFNNKNSISMSNRIFFLGNIGPRKNVHLIVKIAYYLMNLKPKLKIIIAGKIEDNNYFNLLQDFVSQNNLTNIKFMTTISNEEVDVQYSKMGAFLLPSFQETSPAVVIEAMSYSKPVISSDSCGMAYMIDHCNDGIKLEPNNLKLFLAAIIKLFENKKAYYNMSKNAHRKCNDIYHPDVIASKTFEAYSSIYNS